MQAYILVHAVSSKILMTTELLRIYVFASHYGGETAGVDMNEEIT